MHDCFLRLLAYEKWEVKYYNKSLSEKSYKSQEKSSKKVKSKNQSLEIKKLQ